MFWPLVHRNLYVTRTATFQKMATSHLLHCVVLGHSEGVTRSAGPPGTLLGGHGRALSGLSILRTTTCSLGFQRFGPQRAAVNVSLTQRLSPPVGPASVRSRFFLTLCKMEAGSSFIYLKNIMENTCSHADILTCRQTYSTHTHTHVPTHTCAFCRNPPLSSAS